MARERAARVRALAKINLSLKVLHRREDGYHELRTVFQTIGLHDTLELAFTPGRTTSIEIKSGIEIPDNLVARAARLFCAETRVTGRIKCSLVKKIPIGGGLGGGSSDAAAVLLALPALTGRRVELPRLMAMGARLGSDVPFFLVGGTALGIGRGEELYPLPERPATPLLVVAPDVHVSTPVAYAALERELTSLVDVGKLDIFQSFVWHAPGVLDGENDFEPAVFARHPGLRRIRSKLRQAGAIAARLSGSGAALFGTFASKAARTAAAPRFSAHDLRVFATETVSRARYRRMWLRSLAEHVDGNAWPPQGRSAR